ncbi:MAG: enoyl-CoA hydratase-related protein [Pseudomonadota bacterium]
MSPVIRLEKQDGVAAIILMETEGNFLSDRCRAGIVAALRAAEADEGVSHILLACRGARWPSKLPDADYDDPAEPDLGDVCALIEACPKPVIAAIHGPLAGPGVELVMAAHYRVATETARFAMTDVGLGVLPQAGGTQRLPRLVGAEDALDMLLSGREISIGLALQIGLVDRVAAGNLRSEALKLVAEGVGPRPTQDLREAFTDARQYVETVALFRAEVAATASEDNVSDLLLTRIVDCVENAMLLPFDIAMQVEVEAAAEIRQTQYSKALRHAARAEYDAAHFLDLDGVAVPELGTAAVVGDTARGLWATKRLLDVGFDVVLLAGTQDGVEHALDVLGDVYEQAVEAGRITDFEGADILSRLTLTTDPDKIRNKPLYIDLFENSKDRMALFTALDVMAPKEAVFVTQATDEDLLRKLKLTSNRGNAVVGISFVDQFDGGDAAEIVVGPETSSQAVATAHALVQRMGLLPVQASIQDGFIAEKLWRAYRQVCDHLVLSGAGLDEVDAAMEAFGFSEGPFKIRDRLGLTAEKPRDDDPSLLRDALIEAGEIGQTAGRGFYLFADGRASVVNPAVAGVLQAERQARAITQRSFKREEIQDRVVAAFINVAVELLGQGVADRACDIDAIALRGLGYPRDRGGPTFEADRRTTFASAQMLKLLQQEAPEFWHPSELLLRLATERQKISDLELV